MTYPLHVVSRDLPLFEMLNRFQTGKSHLAVVNDPETEKNIGIITLEDVIEELINVCVRRAWVRDITLVPSRIELLSVFDEPGVMNRLLSVSC